MFLAMGFEGFAHNKAVHVREPEEGEEKNDYRRMVCSQLPRSSRIYVFNIGEGDDPKDPEYLTPQPEIFDTFVPKYFKDGKR